MQALQPTPTRLRSPSRPSRLPRKNFTAVNGPNGGGNTRSVILNWQALSNNETGFTIQRATNATFTSGLNTTTVAANAITLTQTGLSRNTKILLPDPGEQHHRFLRMGDVTPLPILTNP